MIIELSQVRYNDNYEALNTLRSMLSMINGTVDVMGYNGEPMSFLEAFEYQLSNLGERMILANLPSFMGSLETLEKSFIAFNGEMLRLYESVSLEELREEAKDCYGTYFEKIDMVVDIYKGNVNGKTIYFEIFE